MNTTGRRLVSIVRNRKYTKPRVAALVLGGVLLAVAFVARDTSRAFGQETSQVTKARPLDDGSAGPRLEVSEARARAKLLHETLAGVLQVMHRDFFREDERLTLPSKSLEDVFEELGRTHGVRLKWLAVNSEAMSVNHQPEDEFEKQAVRELAGDRMDFESVEGDNFRYAGAIRLTASCVKCHVRSRTSNEERKAALTIQIPLRQP